MRGSTLEAGSSSSIGAVLSYELLHGHLGPVLLERGLASRFPIHDDNILNAMIACRSLPPLVG